MNRTRPLLLVIAVVTATMHAMAGGTDPISLKLGRMLKVTDTYLYTTRFSDQQQLLTRLPSGQVLDSSSTRTIEFVAVATIKFVTVEGEEREKTLKVRRFDVTTDGIKHPYLYTGAVISCVFSNDSGSVFMVDGKPVADSVQIALNDILHAEGGLKTGRILDPKKKVRAGDSWKMNVKELLRTVEGDAIKLDKKNTMGMVRLVAIDSTKENGNVAVVLGEARAKRVRLGGMDGLTVGDVHMNMSFGLTVPVDERFPPVESSTMVTMDVPARTKTPDGKTIDLQIRSIRSQDSRFER